MGLLVAPVEWVGGKVVINQLSKVASAEAAKSGIKSLLKSIGAQAATNFTTEAATEALNIVSELAVMDNPNYWVWKSLDPSLTNHVQARFGGDPARGEKMFSTYRQLLDEAVTLKQADENPGSEKSEALAARWWGMLPAVLRGAGKLLFASWSFEAMCSPGLDAKLLLPLVGLILLPLAISAWRLNRIKAE